VEPVDYTETHHASILEEAVEWGKGVAPTRPLASRPNERGDDLPRYRWWT